MASRIEFVLPLSIVWKIVVFSMFSWIKAIESEQFLLGLLHNDYRPLYSSTADSEKIFYHSVISSANAMNDKRVITAWGVRFHRITSARQQGA